MGAKVRRDEGSPIALSLHQTDSHAEKPQVRDMTWHQTWQRDLKCAFLGESGMSIRSRWDVSALRGINSGAVCKPPPERKARLWLSGL